MSSRLTSITEADIAAERERNPGAFAAPLRQRINSWLTWGGATGLTVYCLYRFGFFSGDFLHGVSKFGDTVVGQMFPPTGFDNTGIFLKAIVETVAMAFLGTLLGAVVAMPFSFLASKNMTRSRSVQFGTRCLAALPRPFDYLVLALIFVRAV